MSRVGVLILLAVGCRSQGSAPRRASVAVASPARSVSTPPLRSASAGVSSPHVEEPLELYVTTTDFTVTRPGSKAPVFSYRAWARARFARDLSELAEDDAPLPLTIRELDVTPLSWLGSLVSFREVTMTTMPDHEAHPSGGTRYVTLAVNPSGTEPNHALAVTLHDYFDDRALFRALSAETRARKLLPAAAQPADLEALLTALREAPPVPTCEGFPEDLLSRFVFDHVEGKKLFVNLGLGGDGACRYLQSDLSLTLALPAALAPALTDAERGRGFFAKTKPPGLPAVHVRLTSETTTPIRAGREGATEPARQAAP